MEIPDLQYSSKGIENTRTIAKKMLRVRKRDVNQDTGAMRHGSTGL